MCYGDKKHNGRYPQRLEVEEPSLPALIGWILYKYVPWILLVGLAVYAILYYGG